MNRFGFPTVRYKQRGSTAHAQSAEATASYQLVTGGRTYSRYRGPEAAREHNRSGDEGQGSQRGGDQRLPFEELHMCAKPLCEWRDKWYQDACIETAMDHWVGGTLWRHLLIWHRTTWLAKSTAAAVKAAALRWRNQQRWVAWSQLRAMTHRFRDQRIRLRRVALRWISRELGGALSTWTAYLAAVWRQKNKTLKAVRCHATISFGSIFTKSVSRHLIVSVCLSRPGIGS